jgi:hypothetical protein
MTAPRRFYLDRIRDISGVSGTGRVADGIVWADGTVTIRWLGDRPSTVNWDSLEDAIAIHGHSGATVFEWDEPESGHSRSEELSERDNDANPLRL